MATTSKSELAARVSSRFGMDRPEAAAIIDQLLIEITNACGIGDTVTLTGFGSFVPRHREARTGTHPATGEPIQIAARTTIGFRPSKPRRKA